MSVAAGLGSFQHQQLQVLSYIAVVIHAHKWSLFMVRPDTGRTLGFLSEEARMRKVASEVLSLFKITFGEWAY